MVVPREIQDMIRASAAASLHTPRENWMCRACGEPWVCTVGQDDLRIEFEGRPAALAALLAAYHDGMLRSGIPGDGAWRAAIGWL